MQNNPTVDPLLHSTDKHLFLFHHIQTHIHFYKQDWNRTYSLHFVSVVVTGSKGRPKRILVTNFLDASK